MISVVYFLGHKNSGIDPLTMENLGGAERAVVKLSEEWARSGLNVIVCGPVPTLKHANVTYLNAQTFLSDRRSPILKSDYLIIWRDFGSVYFHRFANRFEYKNLYLDVHDCILNPKLHHTNVICNFVKSKFHHNLLSKTPLLGQYSIIPNGIEIERIDAIKAEKSWVKYPHRICYASSLDRGIIEMMDSWDKVRQAVPDAEFHVFYGRLDFIHDLNLRHKIRQALKKEGVIYHGWVSHDELIRNMLESAMYFYVTECDESDCTVIREASYCECVPIMADHGVFSQRDGIKIPVPTPFSKIFNIASDTIIHFMNNPERLKAISSAKSEFSWSEVAKIWLKYLRYS